MFKKNTFIFLVILEDWNQDDSEILSAYSSQSDALLAVKMVYGNPYIEKQVNHHLYKLEYQPENSYWFRISIERVPFNTYLEHHEEG